MRPTPGSDSKLKRPMMEGALAEVTTGLGAVGRATVVATGKVLVATAGKVLVGTTGKFVGTAMLVGVRVGADAQPTKSRRNRRRTAMSILQGAPLAAA